MVVEHETQAGRSAIGHIVLSEIRHGGKAGGGGNRHPPAALAVGSSAALSVSNSTLNSDRCLTMNRAFTVMPRRSSTTTPAAERSRVVARSITALNAG